MKPYENHMKPYENHMGTIWKAYENHVKTIWKFPEKGARPVVAAGVVNPAAPLQQALGCLEGIAKPCKKFQISE